ncbi:MAG: hypothetical protein AB8B65_04215 [Kordia sp.]|uniref:hypothetical protein n=1 Tax=Kordia sp. TaxID=1965332 RepID=UPI0038584EBC
MKGFLSILFYLIFSAVAIGQDYDALAVQILEDIPLNNFKNEPTFLRISYVKNGDLIDENGKDYSYQTKNTVARTHFLSPKNLARLQRKIKTALIPYLEAQTMQSGIYFHGNPVFKGYPDLMPKFETITHGEIIIYNRKQTIGYFPYKNKPIDVNVQKSLWDYIKQTNHIQLEFHQSSADKVLVTGTINHKKVDLNYQLVYGKWLQVPQLRTSDITHYTHDGELFIKHNNITFEYEKLFDLEDVDVVSETDITPVHKESFASENLISIDSIVDFSFSDLRNLKFTHENEDKSEKYEFFQFNTELFALVYYYKYDGKWSFSEVTLYPYSPISITKNKRIYYLFGEDGGVIIPEKNGIHVYLGKTQRLYNFKDFSTEKQQNHNRNYDTETLAYIANKQKFDLFYQIKEEEGKKRMYNYLGINKLEKAYDSIFVNNFIVGVKDGMYDIYNQAFQKLPLENVRAFHLENTSTTEGSNYIPHSAQIIHKNTLKTIYLSLKKDKKGYLNAYTYHGLPTFDKTTHKISRKNHNLWITRSSIDFPEVFMDKYQIPIKEKEVDYIYFLSNKKQEISYEQVQLRYGLDLRAIIHLKTKQGTHYLYHTSYVNEPTSPFIKTALEEVEAYADWIRFKENNTYGYYGIHKKGRYKKLEAFQGFFAKFELPNGQKGWLDRNGNEYLNL